MSTSEPLSIQIPRDSNIQGVDRLLAGMLLIRQYEPDAYFAAEHDQVFFGSYDTRQQMTSAERTLMEHWNWFESQDAWSHFV